MTVNEKLKMFRKEMETLGIDAYIVPTADPHQSENVPERWKSRQWISGFDGSAGTVVITKSKAVLWADGRYHIQAAEQIKGTEYILQKAGLSDIPTFQKWLSDELPENSTIGFDGKVMAIKKVRDLKRSFAGKHFKLISKFDIFEKIWTDRPTPPQTEVMDHHTKFCGKSRLEKFKEVRKKMSKRKADYFVLASLDDIAWLFNIRGNDIEYCPFSLSYALLSEKKVYLYIDDIKLPKSVFLSLKKDHVCVKAYDEIISDLKKIPEEKSIFLSPESINTELYNTIPKKCRKIEDRNITSCLKCIKNPVEISNLRNTLIKDATAMVKWTFWLYQNLGKTRLTERSVTEKLSEFRFQQEGCLGDSFATIAAYKEHAASMHYHATEESDYELKQEGLLLIDSGGRYLSGTTDTTRTFPLGKLTFEQKRDYTLVLKGVINLSRAKFLKGASGANLDILARGILWDNGINYQCGTGHGIGFFLNVHEGPQNFSLSKNNSYAFEPGMITTVEPGVYKEDRYGIRIENILLTVEDEETEFGTFYKFETINFNPIDTRPIIADLLSEVEINWLNNYHQHVYKTLVPFLDEDEVHWLEKMTSPIICNGFLKKE